MMEILKPIRDLGLEIEIAEDDKIRVYGMDNLNSKSFNIAAEYIRENKPKILNALKSCRGNCQGCRASGFWDYAKYAGKLLCFHYAVYECKSGRPTPCDEIKKCPKRI